MVIGLGGMKSARTFSSHHHYHHPKNPKKVSKRKKILLKRPAHKVNKEDQITLQAFPEYSPEEDQFNDDFDLGDYMDVQKGLINIEEEKAEFEELDSSAEFH